MKESFTTVIIWFISIFSVLGQSSSKMKVLTHDATMNDMNLYYAISESPVIIVNHTIYSVAKGCADMRHYGGTDSDKSMTGIIKTKNTAAQSLAKNDDGSSINRQRGMVSKDKKQSGNTQNRSDDGQISLKELHAESTLKKQDGNTSNKKTEGNTNSKESDGSYTDKDYGAGSARQNTGSAQDEKTWGSTFEKRNTNWTSLEIECVKNPPSGELEIVNYFGSDPIFYYDGESTKPCTIIKAFKK